MFGRNTETPPVAVSGALADAGQPVAGYVATMATNNRASFLQINGASRDYHATRQMATELALVGLVHHHRLRDAHSSPGLFGGPCLSLDTAPILLPAYSSGNSPHLGIVKTIFWPLPCRCRTAAGLPVPSFCGPVPCWLDFRFPIDGTCPSFLYSARVLQQTMSWAFQKTYEPLVVPVIASLVTSLCGEGVAALSDESTKAGFSATAWVVNLPNGQQIGSGFKVPRPLQNQDSYWVEVTGILAIAMLLCMCTKVFHLPHVAATIGSDSLGALTRLFWYEQSMSF